MARFLLRDGNKISASIDPRTLDAYSYKDKQSNVVNALLSARAERQLLNAIAANCGTHAEGDESHQRLKAGIT